MKTNNNLDNFSDNRVVNLLTPRFAPTTSLEFKAPTPRRRPLWQAVRIGAVAAMVAVVVVIGISGVQTSTAREVVERAMTQLLESENCLVRFTANVTENKSSQELYDIDFDGEDELLLNYYHGGAKGGSAHEIYEMTDTELVRKEVIGEEGYFALDGNTIINSEDKTITSFLWCSVSECGIYGYQVHDNGDIYSAYHIHNYVNPSNDSLISDTTYFVQ